MKILNYLNKINQKVKENQVYTTLQAHSFSFFSNSQLALVLLYTSKSSTSISKHIASSSNFPSFSSFSLPLPSPSTSKSAKSPFSTSVLYKLKSFPKLSTSCSFSWTSYWPTQSFSISAYLNTKFPPFLQSESVLNPNFSHKFQVKSLV